MPKPKHTPQVTSAVEPWRLRREETLISKPAMRKSIPRPSSFSRGMPPSVPAKCSTFGPMSMPKMSRNTTSGMRLAVSRESIGEINATSVIQKMEMNWALLSADAASLRVVPEASTVPETSGATVKRDGRVGNIEPHMQTKEYSGRCPGTPLKNLPILHTSHRRSYSRASHLVTLWDIGRPTRKSIHKKHRAT